MRPSFRPTPPRFSDSDAPPSAGRYDQEFLFHLYRGSELLQENAVDEAKAELERALALQPRDTEGQALLGVVYFRLGMYPLAIEIYEQLVQSVPNDITPKINLSLCYLKTGQAEAARARLEEVVHQSPAHKRAWGYLGLVYQRFGEFEKAKVAFERAGHDKLAERMKALVTQFEDDRASDAMDLENDANLPRRGTLRPSLGPTRPSTIPPPHPPVPSASSLPAPPAVPAPASVGVPEATSALLRSLPRSAHPGAAGHGPSRVRLPEPVTRLARETEFIFPESPRVVLHAGGSVLARIDTSFAVRPQWISALSYERVPFSTQSLRRRVSGSSSNEPLGGAAPIVSLIGAGRLIISPHPDTRLLVFTVDREQLYLRESHLVAFEPQVSYESGRLDPQSPSETIVKLGGAGTVVAYGSHQLGSLTVSSDIPLCVKSSRVIGWLGRLLPRQIPPAEAPAGLTTMLGFSGHGTVLVDMD